MMEEEQKKNRRLQFLSFRWRISRAGLLNIYREIESLCRSEPNTDLFLMIKKHNQRVVDQWREKIAGSPYL